MRSLQTPRLHLVPQCAEHAQALFDVLADPRMYLHEGEPPQSPAWLRERLTKLETRRSADGSEQWLNWVVMMTSGRAVGYVQATVQADGTAYVAYMFGSAWWGQGLASEAVSAMMDELAAQHGATRLRAVLKTSNQRSLRLLQGLHFMAAEAEDIDADERMLQRAIPAVPAP